MRITREEDTSGANFAAASLVYLCTLVCICCTLDLRSMSMGKCILYYSIVSAERTQ